MRARLPSRLLLRTLLLVVLVLAGCAPTVRTVPPAHTAPLDFAAPAPDVVVLGISGHCGIPCSAPRDNYDYLSGRGVFDVVADTLTAQGYRVQVAGYASHVPERFGSPFVKEEQRGYLSLVSDLRRIQAVWGRPPRLILIGHSQGAVWTHLLARSTPDIHYDLQIDLDGICILWDAYFQRAAAEQAERLTALGLLSPLKGCEEVPTPLGPRPAKDIVWPNVERNLEVQSKHYPSPVGEGGGLPLSYLFDRVTNVRPDGSRNGIQRLISTWDDHSTVTRPRGEALRWVSARLTAIAQEWRAEDAAR